MVMPIPREDINIVSYPQLCPGIRTSPAPGGLACTYSEHQVLEKVYVSMCSFLHVLMWQCVCMCVCVCARVCVCVCACVCVCVCLCVCAYLYVHLHLSVRVFMNAQVRHGQLL